jgi:hypothetical protein
MAKISKSKNLAAGVTKKTKKAGMVDPKGAYTKVQERTLGNMKNGGMKKAQNGITEDGVLSKIPAAGAMKKTKSKERSADGNYMVKTVTRETPEGKSSSTKRRRTVQGVLRGAPSVQKYKSGGMAKKSKKK